MCGLVFIQLGSNGKIITPKGQCNTYVTCYKIINKQEKDRTQFTKFLIYSGFVGLEISKMVTKTYFTLTLRNLTGCVGG